MLSRACANIKLYHKRQLFLTVELYTGYNLRHCSQPLTDFPFQKVHISSLFYNIFTFSTAKCLISAGTTTDFKFFLVFLCFIQIYVLHLRLSFGKCIGISVCRRPQGPLSHVHILYIGTGSSGARPWLEREGF